MTKFISTAVLLIALCTALHAQTTRKKAPAAKAKAAMAHKSATATDTATLRRYDCFFLEAMMQRQKGNHTAAFDILRHCADLNPQAPEVYFLLAQYYEVLKDKRKALEYFKHAADLNPENHHYLETLAHAYLSNSRFDEGIAALEQLMTTDKSRDDILSMLVQLYVQQGDNPKAIQTLGRLEMLEGKSERISYAKSSIYTQMGDGKAAVDEMRQLAEQYPYDLNYRGMYADMLLMNDAEDEGLKVLKTILDEEPDNTRALISMRAYYKTNNNTEAADSITKAILTNAGTETKTRLSIMRQEISDSENEGGDSTRILNLFNMMEALPSADTGISEMHVAYMDLKKMPQDSIIRVMRHILDIEPDNTSARMHLVAVAAGRNDLPAIIELCKAGRLYNPDNITFYYYLGLAYYQQENYASALEAINGGCEILEDGSADADDNNETNREIASDLYSVRAELLVKTGQKEKAYEAYDKCLAWKDDNTHAMNNYAYYLSMDERDLDKAEQMSYRTIEADPDNANNLDTYAWILFLQGRYAEAKVYIEQALLHDDKESPSAVVTEHAGDIYAMCGDIETAVKMWNKAAEMTPDNKVLKKKIKQKKYLKQ